MQAVKCSTCRQLVFIYDGDVRVGKISAAKATYPDGSKAPPGRFLVRPCGHGKIYGRQDRSLYIDEEMTQNAYKPPGSLTDGNSPPETLTVSVAGVVPPGIDSFPDQGT